MRPRPAAWFELWVAPEDVLLALNAIARTASAELESDTALPAARERAHIDSLLREFAQLSERYRSHWPAATEPRVQGAPVEVLTRGLERLRKWAAQAEPAVRALEALAADAANLEPLRTLVEALGETSLDLGAFARQKGTLEPTAAVLARDTATLPIPADSLVSEVASESERFVLVLATGTATQLLRREVAARHGRLIRLSVWLAAGREQNLGRIAQERARLADEAASIAGRLAALARAHELAPTLGEVTRAAWCCARVGPEERKGALSRVTGWTSDRARLRAAIEQSGARALVRFPPAPPRFQPPLLLANPPWARPFEIFMRLLGMPGRAAADPTLLLAAIVPLLFGYMFPDVGQGLVLAAAGYALRRRWPLLGMLLPCGLSAAAFGALFGSVFANEQLVHALWVRPLDEPLTVLAVSLAGGAVLLGLGLALAALEACWSGEARRWLEHEPGLWLAYVGLLSAFFSPAGFALALIAPVYAAGAALIAGHGARGTLEALASLAERTFQILLNTLSFIRVGAFALGHAGLSAAVFTLAEGAASAWQQAMIYLAGNLLIIAIEILVVSVQTTRLVLFEFFIRFFIGQGREFRPLAPPSSHYEEILHEART